MTGVTRKNPAKEFDVYDPVPNLTWVVDTLALPLAVTVRFMPLPLITGIDPMAMPGPTEMPGSMVMVMIGILL